VESLGLRSLTKETIATAGKSITGDGTPVSPLQLVNDEINPGNSEYYGTNAAGVKGYYPITGGGGTPSDIPALPLGPSASPGFSTEVSRYDHVHPFPAASSIGAASETRTLTAGTGLTGGGNLTADRTFSVVNDTTIQQIQVLNAGTTVGNRSMINIIGGGSVQVVTSANPSSNRIDITVSAPTGGGGGPPLSNTVATSLGVASAGVGTDASRFDHVHPLPSVTDLGAVPTTRTLTAGTGLSGGGDLTADRTFTVVNDTTVQQIQVLSAGTTVASRSMLNFIAGGTLQISVSNNPSSNRVDVLVSATGGAGGGGVTLNKVVSQRYVAY
jgi:hypothetical protein